MKELEMSGAPFGRPPVAGIAVPPFETVDQFQSFHQALQLYIACLDAEGVSLSSFTLDRLVERSRHRGRYNLVEHPEPHVLEIAIATYFPAPWTPLGIHTELETTGLGSGTGGRVPGQGGSDHSFRWGDSETNMTASREENGCWTVIRWSRGVERVEATLDNDDDMVLYRQSEERSFPVPFGARYNPAAVPPLEAATEQVRAAWARHTTYPYITTWVERNA